MLAAVTWSDRWMFIAPRCCAEPSGEMLESWLGEIQSRLIRLRKSGAKLVRDKD